MGQPDLAPLAPSDEHFMPWNPPRLADLMRRPHRHEVVDRGVRLVNKTGTISTVRADVGVVEGPAANTANAVLASRADDVTCATRCSPI